MANSTEESSAQSPGPDSPRLSSDWASAGSAALTNRIDLVCDLFEREWKAGRRPSLAEHLGNVLQSERRSCFRELVALELEFRRARGEQPGLVEYLSRYPEYADLLPTLGFGNVAPGHIYYDVCAETGNICNVSEPIEGETLEARLKRAPLPIAEAVELIARVADTLHGAHLQDMVHRDLKPGNILLDRSGRPLVADFGLAVTEQDHIHSRKTLIGPSPYISPEQACGKSRHPDPRSDIFSLGVVLYELLTHRLPFLAQTQSEYIDQLLNREIPPPRTINAQIPAELETICMRCLAKRPGDRYTTALDIAADLRAWQRASGRNAECPASSTSLTARGTNSRRGLLIGIAVAIAALAAAAAWIFR